MGNAAGSMEVPVQREAGPQRLKLQMPPEDELEERFRAVLNTMNLPPDKVKVLGQYDLEKKWDLICDQERFQVKNPPSAYLDQLKSFLDHGGVGRKFKRRVQESTAVLRELEISLRTNHIGWAQEFLDEDNRGLDVLVDYLSHAHSAVTLDADCVDGASLSSDKKSLDRSLEDVSRSGSSSPSHSASKPGKTFTGRFNSLQNRKVARSSRAASPKDDVHLCVMCLRAIMNYQSGFSLVMTHPFCVNAITLSLNNRNPRTKALVLELLAAVCLVRGGHDIILSAFDHFKEVCAERSRFQKLMEFFCSDDNNIDFMVACMQFINIVVHSVENMNFRVHLQYEFTQHELDDHLQRLKFTESERLRVQIQAYLDNVFDVAALLEDVEELQGHNTQLSCRLQDNERQTMDKVSEFELKLLQATKEAEQLKESLREACSQVALLQQRERVSELQRASDREREREREELGVKVQALVEQGLVRMERSPSGDLELQVVPVIQHQTAKDEGSGDEATPTCSSNPPPPPPPPVAPPPPPPPPPPPLMPPGGGAPQLSGTGGTSGGTSVGCDQKTRIQTTCRLPLLNWQPLASHQVTGTVFNELDDGHVLQELNMAAFEEQFKTKAQWGPAAPGTLPMKLALKSPSKVSLMEPNRAKNLAITLRKEGMAAPDICSAIETYDLGALSLDFLELLERFVPSEDERGRIQGHERQGRPLDELGEEDRFMVHFSRIPRLRQRIRALAFMGSFPESVQLIRPQLDAVIAASMSIKSSGKLKKVLEVVLAFGNYMNSSKRAAAAASGFRLQSLDLLPETKSTDRRQTLLHFIAGVIRENYPEAHSFYSELHFLDRAATVSLDSVLQDVRALERGMAATAAESSLEPENPVLRTFLGRNAEPLDALVADGRTAQDVFHSAVGYFGENSRATPPSVFFPVFVRFIKAYKEAARDNEQKRKLVLNCETDVVEDKVSMATRLPQMDLIAELKRRQVSPLVREGKDGAIEDIITDLRKQPYRRTDGGRRSAKWKAGQQLHVSSDISL